MCGGGTCTSHSWGQCCGVARGKQGRGWLQLSPAAEQEGLGSFVFIHHFLCSLYQKSKATKGSALLGKLPGRNPSAECRCEAVSTHGNGGKGPPAWQPPSHAQPGSCLPMGATWGSPSCSLLGFNLLVMGFSGAAASALGAVVLVQDPVALG